MQKLFKFAIIFLTFLNANELIEATKIGNFDKIKELVKNGADVNFKDQYGRTALDYSVRKKEDTSKENFKIARYLVKNGTDISYLVGKNKIFPNELFFFVAIGDLEKTKELIKNTTDINFQSRHGFTILMFASGVGNLEIVKELIKNGADINLITNNNKSAMSIAIDQEKFDVARYLAKKGFNLNTLVGKNRKYKNKILFFAKINDFEKVKELIKHDFNFQGRDAESILLVSVLKNNFELVKYLIENGTSYETENYYGETIFDVALDKSYFEIMKFIIDADLFFQDENSKLEDNIYILKTLLLAVRKNNFQTIDFLIKNNYLDAETILRIAKNHNYPDTEKYIKKLKMSN
jgi:ankyrin repeat protein